MTVKPGGMTSAAGHPLEVNREDRLLWGLAGAVLLCLLLALVLMAAWAPIFGVILVASYVPCACGVIFLGRLRAERRTALLRSLAIAVAQGMPLPEALEALAEQQRSGRLRRRVRTVAGLLRAGAPLPEALALVPGTMSPGITALLGAAWKSGHLPEALREAADVEAVSQPIRTDVATRIGYLMVVLLIGQVITSFIFYFVIPKFEAIFFDFGVPLPQVTIAVIYASHWAARYGWPFMLLILAADLTLPVVMPMSIGGWIEGGIPLIDRLFPSRHTAPILRALAWMAESGQPLVPGISGLWRNSSSRWVRRRLDLVLRDLGEGADVWQSLRKRGVIRRSDAALLESASRVGNLPWALREAALGAERRSVARIQTWLLGLSALVMLVLGVLVLLITTAIFTPLVNLIRGLAG